MTDTKHTPTPDEPTADANRLYEMTYAEYLEFEGIVPDEDGTRAWVIRKEFDPEAYDEMVRDDQRALAKAEGGAA